MENILQTIAEYARFRTAEAQKAVPLEAVRRTALSMPLATGFPFERALRRNRYDGVRFICECKKASPSKGVIAATYPYAEIARDYERAGAAAISVLTEPKWFLGDNRHLREIADAVRIPCLRKDFTVDPYMIYEAKVLGAAAVLLICALLDPDTLRRYLALCDELGLSALVEAHDAAEIESACRAGARVIGVNNRNLRDFSVDPGNSARLRALVPPACLFVSESGVRSAADCVCARDGGADAALVGESLMRAPDSAARRRALQDFQKAVRLAPRVKLCGLRSAADVAHVRKLPCGQRPAYAGFILTPGYRRSVSPDEAVRLAAMLSAPAGSAGPDGAAEASAKTAAEAAAGDPVTPVAVFVHAPIPEIVRVARTGAFGAVQLHGSEDAVYIAALREALRGCAGPAAPAAGVAPAAGAAPAARDGTPGDATAGAGAPIQIWDARAVRSPTDVAQAGESAADCVLLDSPAPGSGIPFDRDWLNRADYNYFVSGGLSTDNLESALAKRPYGVDVSSGVETDGVKDFGKMLRFTEIARSYPAARPQMQTETGTGTGKDGST